MTFNKIFNVTIIGLGTIATTLFLRNNLQQPEIVTQKPAIEQLVNNDCGVPQAYLFKTNTSSQVYKTPFGIEMQTNHRKDTQGWIGYDKDNGLYFRATTKPWHDNSAPFKTHFFKDAYVPMGDEMACDLAQELLK